MRCPRIEPWLFLATVVLASAIYQPEDGIDCDGLLPSKQRLPLAHLDRRQATPATSNATATNAQADEAVASGANDLPGTGFFAYDASKTVKDQNINANVFAATLAASVALAMLYTWFIIS